MTYLVYEMYLGRQAGTFHDKQAALDYARTNAAKVPDDAGMVVVTVADERAAAIPFTIGDVDELVEAGCHLVRRITP